MANEVGVRKQKMVMGKRRIYKTQSWLELLVVLVVIAIANAMAGYYYKRFDLTKEKRYTLSETSKKLCSQLTEKMYCKFYLEGEMSRHFKQLRNEVRDMAYEFREASGRKIEIEIVDPLAGKENTERAKVLESFAQKGIEPIRDIEDESGDETKIRYIIPGAEFNYKNKTVTATFFNYDVAKTPEENIQNAIDNIEYEMANALRQCVVTKQKKIVVADGNGEMIGNEVGFFANELQKYYSVEAVNLNVADPEAGAPFVQRMQANPDSAELILMNSLQRRLNLADLLLIVKPIKDYTPAELYLIDQFMMKGGKVMWLIDPVHIEIDSFQTRETVLAVDRGLENINASLFTYGVSFNSDMIQDAVCNRIPIPVGGRPELINFYYFPLFTSDDGHLITKNLGAVWSQFPASMKAKVREGITMTPLLTSSTHTKITHAPATVELMNAYMQGRSKEYVNGMNEGIQTSGLLMEGAFRSAFANQKKFTGIPFVPQGKTKMIVLSDADIMRNFVSGRGATYPTGYDRFSEITFANKKFLLNCVDYLIDDNGLIEIRGKELGLRLLDPTRIKAEKSKWQQINVVAPNLVILLFGLANFAWRKRRYTRKAA